ncbi:MAG: hypothetical protein Q7T55_09610 [Solirubrobacteraceae bacterium]|nr:hypothetical protein [Solirubrobacteraceae bacterium]
MKRSALSLFACVAVATAALPASGAVAETPTRVGVDQVMNVSFRLTGASLTVTLRDDNGEVNKIAKQVSGKTVSVACSGKNPRSRKTVVAYKDFTWKKNRTVATVELSADVSDGVDWCVLERPKPPRKDYAMSKKMRVPNPNAPQPTTPEQ